MKKLIITCIIFLFANGSIYSQEKLVKGRLISESLEILPFASILINDTSEVGKTDVNGYFQINIPVLQHNIIFRFLGLESTNINLENNCTKVEVILMLDGTYDFISLKKVDRLRKKRYKKLPELRIKAYQKGIFKSLDACYKQVFMPYYKKTQK